MSDWMCAHCGYLNKPDAPLCVKCRGRGAPAVGSPLDRQEAGSHYKSMKIQPVEFCQVNGLGFCESSVVKYVCRHRQKNGAEDIRKAIHFLELLLEIEYSKYLPSLEDVQAAYLAAKSPAE